MWRVYPNVRCARFRKKHHGEAVTPVTRRRSSTTTLSNSSLLKDNDLPFDGAAKKAYRLQWAFAEAMAQQGFSVIIDSTCNFQEVVDRGFEIAEQYGLVYWYVECKVEDIDLLDERLRRRTPLTSQRAGVERPPEAAGGAREGEDSRALFRK
jgi:hypothetical protein